MLNESEKDLIESQLEELQKKIYFTYQRYQGVEERASCKTQMPRI
jgi:hypothetical protein